MAIYQDFYLYLTTLKSFGILSFSYDEEQDRLHVTFKDKLYAKIVFCVIQFLVFSMLTFYIMNPHYFVAATYNRTGNIYFSFEFYFCCLLISFINAYFYMNQNKQIQTVQKLQQLNKDKNLPETCLKSLRQLFGIYIFLLVLCCQNYARGFWKSGLPFAGLIMSTIILSLNFMLCGMIMVWYTCIKGVLEHHFQCCNEKFEHFLKVLNQRDVHIEFRKILISYYSLLNICENNVNTSYGLVMLLISMYTVFSSPSGIFFLITVVFDNKSLSFLDKLHLTIHSLLWNMPWLIIFSVMLSTMRVEQEANKTAKILSKLPRKDTSVERMVQKFLIKNLRQKPILTAYGFFSLNKSTLFNLFAAIFTYMVILVQFKEMESSRKQLGQLVFNDISPA